MNDDSTVRANEAPGDGERTDAVLDELRRLLLAPEQDRLDGLQHRLDDPDLLARDLSRVLPEAIALRLGRDRNLTRAIAPAVVDVLQDSVRKNPRMLADAFFPIIGPAIRKAIRSTLGEMVESINQVVEHTFTVRGLRWRLEAVRTGRPFAEIVLLHSLIYRVEQVFLIHRETGLLLLHIVEGSAAATDADMASAMLTAIRDFVSDTFATEGESVEALRVGDLNVLVEQGPRAILAVVVRGSPHPEIREVLTDELETIHLEHIEELTRFNGDSAPFETCADNLDRCLKARYEAPRKGTSPIVWVTLVCGALLLVWWLGAGALDAWRWSRATQRIAQQPGIVVTDEYRSGGRYHISGLRDPLAPDPLEILTEEGIDQGLVDARWSPFQAAHPPFVVTRARALLHPPDTVTLRMANGVLTATGVADAQWIAEAKRLGPFVPGAFAFDANGVSDPNTAVLETARLQVESIVLKFVVGTTQLSPDGAAAFVDLASSVRALDEAAWAQGGRVRIEVVGHADPSGQDPINMELSSRRAETVRARIDELNLRATTVDARGAGTANPILNPTGEVDPDANRSASFTVAVDRSTTTKERR